MAIFVLQAFAIERGTSSRCAEQEASRAQVAGGPCQIADALHAECIECKREMAWDLFESRILRPMLEGAPAPSYESLMERWKLTAPSQVSNTIVTMRRAFAAHLVRMMGAASDTSPAGARGELRELLTLLEGRMQ